MILDENFAILEEDEDFDLLEEEDEILMEGEILDEELMQYSVIKGPKDIDKDASRKAIQKMQDKVNSMKNSGNYRDFKSSDKNLLARALKSKEFMTTIFGAGGGISKMLSQIRYSVFKFEGMTLCSVYFPANVVQKTGWVGKKQSVFVVLVKDNGDEVKNKVVLKTLSLKPTKQNVRDKIDM